MTTSIFYKVKIANRPPSYNALQNPQKCNFLELITFSKKFKSAILFAPLTLYAAISYSTIIPFLEHYAIL